VGDEERVGEGVEGGVACFGLTGVPFFEVGEASGDLAAVFCGADDAGFEWGEGGGHGFGDGCAVSEGSVHAFEGFAEGGVGGVAEEEFEAFVDGNAGSGEAGEFAEEDRLAGWIHEMWWGGGGEGSGAGFHPWEDLEAVFVSEAAADDDDEGDETGSGGDGCGHDCEFI
jgi:hypothetical protein